MHTNDTSQASAQLGCSWGMYGIWQAWMVTRTWARDCGLVLAGAAIAGAMQWAIGPSERDHGPSCLAQAVGQLERLERNSAPASVVFLGSSTFAGMDVRRVLPQALNLSAGGGTLAEFSRRLFAAHVLSDAKALVINLGFNDVLKDCKALTEADWSTGLAALPSTPSLLLVGLQGVGPVAQEHHCQGRLNHLLAQSNLALEAACRQRARCSFTPNPVEASSPARRGPLQAEDEIHLSPAGYELLHQRIRSGLQTLGIPAPAASDRL
ncbi:SGNH/GDSL hydrolase family protein [Paucibacter sediminis]|uniref:SGNH/GDSL hydrolase family protein n=1 Tax=Paucibacter sediminis TaxID=3019553 RepID=A0AA95NFW4_9BURK|nr:SGNH/GDSL hydrolase family protein [Paucibacter sp. S2-9]WIT11343.1 SGNH/GDSL hydrolase family protein [Paucibacter sp. S2-9]